MIKISAFRDSLEQTLLSNLLTLIPNIVTQVVRSKSEQTPDSLSALCILHKMETPGSRRASGRCFRFEDPRQVLGKGL